VAVTKNEKIIQELELLAPYGRPVWGLTYVISAELREKIIAALRPKQAKRVKPDAAFGKTPE
jgi:hypothetical protein